MTCADCGILVTEHSGGPPGRRCSMHDTSHRNWLRDLESDKTLNPKLSKLELRLVEKLALTRSVGQVAEDWGIHQVSLCRMIQIICARLQRGEPDLWAHAIALRTLIPDRFR